ncbi:MAG: NUDIX domain-containing protein, partial [Firmicutes bacterium]|nr:NUDIX domain-containing protein [Bacillota bacterium]
NLEGTYKVLIAGFVKQGERLEECVAREIKEEVGIEITRCTYINSHYYNRNNVLMVGFHAETDQTEFIKDEIEIHEVDWYNKHEVIGKIRDGSIADMLYKQFYASYKNQG